MKKILAIVGPTATGKTDIALELAKSFNGELICCDSRQLYTGLDIGTGKAPNSEQTVVKKAGHWVINEIPVWLYDIADPKERFSVKDYVEMASQRIKKIWQEDKLPIIVGGTGYYLKSLLEGVATSELPQDPLLRLELQKLSITELQQRLQASNYQRFVSMNSSDKKNPRRLTRAIETADHIQKMSNPLEDHQLLLIGLTAPKPILNQRIDNRVDKRMEQGMFEEAQRLYDQGLSLDRMRELGLEYRYLADLLEQNITKEQFLEVLKTKIHQYAKRQLTWFKNQQMGKSKVLWFDITEQSYQQKLVKQVRSWYDQNDES